MRQRERSREAEFDRTVGVLAGEAVILSQTQRWRIDRQWLGEFTGDLPWLCTLEDFRFPGFTGSPGTLANLALTLGVPVTSAHRALTSPAALGDLHAAARARR